MNPFEIALTGAVLAVAGMPLWREWQRRPIRADRGDSAPGQFANLPKGPTHFDWLGPEQGPVAVCIHGLTTPSYVWLPLTRHLVAMGYRVLIYDLYGRGWSARPYGLQTSAFHVAQLTDLLEHEDVGDDITVFGYSMGGAIATAFAAQDPERIRQLILLAPAGMGHELGPLARLATDWPLIGDWIFHMRFPAQERATAASSDKSAPATSVEIRDRVLLDLDKRGYVRSVLSSLRGILRRPLEEQHCALAGTGLPILAVWGQEDTVIPLRAMGVLTQWNRSVRHEVIDGAGHGLPHTHVEALATILGNELLSDHNPASVAPPSYDPQ